ncbi:MAG: type I DNA topoisomerase [Spirochaetaceae bacterium]|jgi:DNA topoisomerase-1|nr:type I DNA topoisomerase [Spirochaetaceae bacterium]
MAKAKEPVKTEAGEEAPKKKAPKKAAAKKKTVKKISEKTDDKAVLPKKPTVKKAVSKTTAKKKIRKYTLVIVESPAKASTIEKYLGSGYMVKACMGHLIDLPKSRIAIDVENNFEPEYITVRGRAKILKQLQTDAKNSQCVLLASDPDREGEAIAWHLNNSFSEKNKDLPIKRITFNEITPAAIKDAVANPALIDESKVNAQKARRVLDRLVGYNLSPLLWKKIKNGLSAGRVQSVALRLVCEREKELEAFTPEEYWTLDAVFKAGKSSFIAQLVNWNGATPSLKKEADVKDIISKISGSTGTVSDIRESDKTLKPRPPFTTSQLQQTAANRLGFTSRKTMQIAQRLYEGVNVGSTRVGLITYMRTDSVRISDTALNDVREWIGKSFPNDLPAQALHYTTGKTAQDAHEAIRPTYTKYTPEAVKNSLSRDELRLYSIIWERFVASQMNPAKTRTLSADIAVKEALFRVAGTTILEKGYLNVLSVLASKDEKVSFPPIKSGDILSVTKFDPLQHWTQGPARYTDGSIIKTLEEKGIGRPATYAPTISLLLDRYYITRTNKQLVPTILGRMVCNMLVENFGDIINAEFTAAMETNLDEVESKSRPWPEMLHSFFKPFIARVEEMSKNLESQKDSLVEITNEKCEKCGKPMLKKLGRFGYFLACSGFPECRSTKSIPLAKCPKCGGDVVARKTKKRGKEFYGCVNYPECDFISHFKPIEQNCPKCGWFMVEKYDKRNGTHKACINPECDYLHSVDEQV